MHLFLGDGLRVRRPHHGRVAPCVQLRPDQDQSEEDADRQGPLTVLSRQPPREDHGRQPVRANNVAVEEDAVDKAEQDHPQAATSHKAASVNSGLLAGPCLLRRRRLTPGFRCAQSLQVGLCTARNTSVDHDGQPESEEHGEQRVSPVF